MSENYSFPDFLSYCTTSHNSMRVDGEVFWFNKIPVPIVLVKKVFFSMDVILKSYSNHLLSALSLALYELSQSEQHGLFADFPDPDALRIKQADGSIQAAWEFCQGIQLFKQFEQTLGLLTGLPNTELSLAEFERSLSFKAKKYDRLYFPESIKVELLRDFPKALDFLTRAKGDFFGNVIADDLSIYRAGFGDAFSGVFNHYLDFKFDRFPRLDPREAVVGHFEDLTVKGMGSVKLVDYADGQLWDPFLQHEGGVGVEVDKNHPVLDLPAEDQLMCLLLSLAKEEMAIFDDSLKEAIESFRFRVSHTLRSYSAPRD